MALRKTPDEKAAAARRRAEEKAVAELEQERQAFLRSPAGQARTAFERGDQVFQYSWNVMSQQAIIVPMVGSSTAKRTATRPTS